MRCSRKHDSLMSFIKFVIPAKRMVGDHHVYLIKKKPNNINFKGHLHINNKTKDAFLPLVFQAIDNLTI